MESQDTINKILEFWLFLLKVDDISNVVLNTAHSAFFFDSFLSGRFKVHNTSVKLQTSVQSQ